MTMAKEGNTSPLEDKSEERSDSSGREKKGGIGSARGKNKADVVEIPRRELEELREKASKAGEHWDRILRLNAEFENTKKRLEKKTSELIQFGNEKLLLEVLPVVDDLDRAMASLEEGHDLESVRKGLQLVQDNFHRILEQNGVKIIEAVGQLFDPHWHEAVGELVTDQFDEGHVAEEIQRGYTLNGRLARPSRVRVARKRSQSGGK